MLAVRGPISTADLPGLSDRVCDLLSASEAELVICDVSGLGDPDVVAIDAIARLTLAARRLGRRVRLHNASPKLRDLIGLVGLSEVLLEASGEAEEREQGGRVEELVEPDDPPP